MQASRTERSYLVRAIEGSHTLVDRCEAKVRLYQGHLTEVAHATVYLRDVEHLRSADPLFLSGLYCSLGLGRMHHFVAPSGLDFLLNFPNDHEGLVQIFRFLNLEDVPHIRASCRRLHGID